MGNNLTAEEKRKLRNEVSDKTLNASLQLLKDYGKCMVVRPTGFGKSFMLARITGSYNKSLYVYPTTIIKNAVLNDYGPNGTGGAKLHNTDFISYSALNNKYKDGVVEDFFGEYDLIMLDEVHMAGAAGFMSIWREVQELFSANGKHIIGVTATPNRQSKTKFADGHEEMVNILNDIFDGHQIFRYSMKDCIASGLMVSPAYAQVVYDTEELKGTLKKKLEKVRRKSEANEMMKEDTSKLINELMRTMNNIENAPAQIKRIIDATMGNRASYMKFITFCRNKKDISDRREKVTQWFTEAFPEMQVREHIIVSKQDTADLDYENEIKKAEELNNINEENDTIDIIYCVDMLNMGYHIDNIDGVIMLRGTESEIIYLQQIGRCMSVKSTRSPIILDFVRNADVHSLFKDDKGTGKNADSNQLDDEDGDDVLTKQDIYMQAFEDGTGSFLSKIDEAMDAMSNPEDREADMISWWYTEMKAPIYVILRLMGKPVNDNNIAKVLEKLKSRGVAIEKETNSLKVGGPITKQLPASYISRFR